MLEMLKKMAKDNWKGAVVGAVVVALTLLFGVPTKTLFDASTLLTDDDVRAQLQEELCEVPVSDSKEGEDTVE